MKRGDGAGRKQSREFCLLRWAYLNEPLSDKKPGKCYYQDMSGIIAGLILLLLSLYIALPFDWTLGWTEEFIFVLKGMAPFIAFVVGFFFILVGMADLLDVYTAKKQKERIDAEEKREKSSTSP